MFLSVNIPSHNNDSSPCLNILRSYAMCNIICSVPTNRNIQKYVWWVPCSTNNWYWPKVRSLSKNTSNINWNFSFVHLTRSVLTELYLVEIRFQDIMDKRSKWKCVWAGESIWTAHYNLNYNLLFSYNSLGRTLLFC